VDGLEAMSILLTVVESGSRARLRVVVPAHRWRSPAARFATLRRGLRRGSNSTQPSRQFVLTASGRSYVEACKRILQVVDEAERAATGEYSAPKGQLIISAPVVLGCLCQPSPSSSRPIGTSMSADRTINLLEDHIEPAARVGALSDSGLGATRVGTVRLAGRGSPAYFAARGMPRRPAELGAHDCVTIEILALAWRFSAGKSDVSVVSAGGSAP